MARGVDERNNPKRRGISPEDYVWIDGEPFSRSEVWEEAGFKERSPEYDLQKRKERKRK